MKMNLMKEDTFEKTILKKSMLIIILFILNVHIASCNFYMDNLYEDMDNEEDNWILLWMI